MTWQRLSLPTILVDSAGVASLPPYANPADVIADMLKEAGFEVDPERVAMARTICDEPVDYKHGRNG